MKQEKKNDMSQNIIPLVPRCPECQTFLPYKGAPHSRHDCSRHKENIPRDPVEWTVYSQYAPYPILYGRSAWSRWFIFNHLFFAIGNGYTWTDGGLRDIDPERFPVGAVIPFRTFEEEEAEILREEPPCEGKGAARLRELIEEANQETRAKLHKEWAQFETKPQKWYPVSEDSRIFTLPEDASDLWLLAACDACQMFLQGNADGQSLRQVYKLIELRAQLFARVGLPIPPALEETRMTTELLHRDEASL